MRMLIVDDEVELRDAIIQLLGSEKISFTCAGSGGEALSLCLQQDFDLILTDERMPGGNGMEFVAKLKAAKANLPPVALMTGHSEVDITKAAEIGILRVFKKPFTFKEIREFVQLYIM